MALKLVLPRSRRKNTESFWEKGLCVGCYCIVGQAVTALVDWRPLCLTSASRISYYSPTLSFKPIDIVSATKKHYKVLLTA